MPLPFWPACFSFFQSQSFFKRSALFYFLGKEVELMEYRNEKHRVVFSEAIKRLNQKDKALMAALYLLTAEHKR